MSLLSLKEADAYLYFDEAECRAAGRTLAERYRNAAPFPHIVIDDFLSADMLRDVARHYPDTAGKTFFDREQERFKFQFHADEVPSGRTRNLLAELNGKAFLGFLEEMTGIAGLISDPYLAGGGLHLTKPGGKLGIHADFNVHTAMQVERRLNLLVYLNDDWRDAYGGKLELWDRQMKACEVSVAPEIGRAVVFSTDLDSYHGHPDPLACPPDRDRRSIATYYYTALPQEAGYVPRRNTQFRARTGTGDRPDWRVRVNHAVSDWVPPKLQPLIRRAMDRI